jgi:hypothetical protein
MWKTLKLSLLGLRLFKDFYGIREDKYSMTEVNNLEIYSRFTK